MSTDYSNRRKTSSTGCISWLSHLIPHRHRGKSSVTSSSWSEDDSDSNDAAAMTSYRDVTSSRCSQGQQALTGQEVMSSPGVMTSVASAGASCSPSDLVETFDVYYVLPPSAARRRPGQRGQLAARQNPHGAEVMSSACMTKRRRPTAGTGKCLLDAVPPTPGCYNDLRAATLPASASHFVNPCRSSPPHHGFEYYKIPRAPVASEMYSRPRCACVACSDLTQADGIALYRQPTSRSIYRNNDDDDVYYNYNEVDRLHDTCSCFSGRSVNAAGRQRRTFNLQQADAATSYGDSYDAVPTPIPLNYANMRRCRRGAGNDTAEPPQYSVPVRWTDCDAVYDNQETIDRRSRCAVHADPRLTHQGTSSVGDARIMRFVELRQVRESTNEHEELQDAEIDRQRARGFRPYVTEDRYIVSPHPTLAERSTPSRHLYYPRAGDEWNATYTNVDSAPSSCQRTPPNLPLEEDHLENIDTGDASGPEEHAKEFCKASAAKEKHLDEEDEDAGRAAVSTDNSENAALTTKGDDMRKTGSTTQTENKMRNENSGSCGERSESRQKTQSEDTPAARPPAQFRLRDAYLLRMSPPPPSHQADGRRRAAYSDPVRWVSPLSCTERPARQPPPQAKNVISPPTTSQITTPNNGFRSHESSTGTRTAAMTCTNEALDEAIRRRNRKCKPSAMRRLQAAKALTGVEPETHATVTSQSSSSSFEPIFEGVACSLRTRSASLTDCNAIAMERDLHALNF